MKFFQLWAVFEIVFLGGVATSLASSLQIPMKANFSEVNSEKAPCDVVFANRAYEIDFHILSQPRGAIIYFKNEEVFFGKSNIVARRGYEDLFFEKTTQSSEFPGIEFKIKGEGLYSADLILLDFQLEAYEKFKFPHQSLCFAQAQFFATRHH